MYFATFALIPYCQQFAVAVIYKDVTLVILVVDVQRGLQP